MNQQHSSVVRRGLRVVLVTALAVAVVGCSSDDSGQSGPVATVTAPAVTVTAAPVTTTSVRTTTTTDFRTDTRVVTTREVAITTMKVVTTRTVPKTVVTTVTESVPLARPRSRRPPHRWPQARRSGRSSAAPATTSSMWTWVPTPAS